MYGFILQRPQQVLRQQVDYVLGKWNETELEQLPERLERSTALIRSFVLAGAARTMNTFNGTLSESPEIVHPPPLYRIP